LKKVRAVVDTNVIVSGIISPHGAPRKVLELAIKETFTVITSASINREVLSVLHRDYIYEKYHLDEQLIDAIASFLYEGTIIVSDKLKKTLMIINFFLLPLKVRQIILFRVINTYFH